MRKYSYRLKYEYLFVPVNPANSKVTTIKNDTENISGLSIFIKYKIFRNGKEVLFVNNEPVDTGFAIDEKFSCYVSDFIECVFNKDSLYKLLPTAKLEYANSKGYKIFYEVCEYAKDIEINPVYSEGTFCSKEEFERLFKENIEFFNNSNNFPAQVPSYGCEVVNVE